MKILSYPSRAVLVRQLVDRKLITHQGDRVGIPLSPLLKERIVVAVHHVHGRVQRPAVELARTLDIPAKFRHL